MAKLNFGGNMAKLKIVESESLEKLFREELCNELRSGTIFHTRQPPSTQKHERKVAPFNVGQVEFYEECAGDSQ